MEIQPLLAGKRVIGTKQTLKAIKFERVSAVYLARDVDATVGIPLQEACLLHEIEVIVVDTKVNLGKMCGLTIGAAACAILE